MPKREQIVAIGLLTRHELDLLGEGFDRAFPINDELVFEDLLRAIDEADRALQARTGCHEQMTTRPRQGN